MSFFMKCFAALFVFAALVSAQQGFQSGQAAWAVIGQMGFTTETYPPNQSVMATPGGVAWANGNLLVTDGNRIGATSFDVNQNPTTGNRVLIFNNSANTFLPSPYTNVSEFGNATNPRCPVCGFPAQLVLGQSDFNGTDEGLSANGMRNPTAVASDGTVVAVADTDNNRVLLWTTFPTSIGQPANVVLGQANFTTVSSANTVAANTLRGPQGVWIQNGKLFVADTQNQRVLIWNSIPTQNQQPADLVLGQANLTSAVMPNQASSTITAAANQLFSPTSVTSDGTRLYVSDLGFNRVLIWNSIPTSIDQPADVVVGQPDMTQAAENNVPNLCAPTGTDSSGNKTYSPRCANSLDFPRYALSDGTRLFIADGGNDRIQVFNTIPTTNGAAADLVIGQPDMVSDVVSDPTLSFASTIIPNRASTGTIRTPTSLAWDGANLYATDPYDLRVMVFNEGGNQSLQPSSILNAASLAIYQEGVVSLGGTINSGDTVTITVGNSSTSTTNNYTYTVVKTDTLNSVAAGLATNINANSGDPNVIAESDTLGDVLLQSRQSDLPNDTISLSASVSSSADITATASGTYLTGGNAAIIAPGTIVVINGNNLTNGQTAAAPDNVTALPTVLAGAQVFMDGNPAPLLYASPTQIKAQLPTTFTDANSSSIFVQTTPTSGPVQITNAMPIIIATANPGVFTNTGTQLGPATAVHSSNYASAVVSVDGSVTAGDTGTITIASNSYTYTVLSTDTLDSVRNAFINLINGGNDPNVVASAGGQFDRVVLTAKAAGSAGNGIAVSGTVSSNATLVLTAYTSSTCCANTAGAPVTASNPAQPNETISVITTGLGPLYNVAEPTTGQGYSGPTPNTVLSTVSATLGASTAQVINAGLPAGSIGLYQVDLIIPSGAASNPTSQLYIAQNAFVSNIVTLPVAGSGSSLVTFTASPNPIVAPGVSVVQGQTTLNWNVTSGTSEVEIHIGSPDGPLFVQSGASGSATTGTWVTNGMTFYLQDVSNGKTLSAVNTLATIDMQVGTLQSVTTFSASEVDLPPGISSGPSTLTWNAPASTTVEIHLNSPTGPLFTQQGPSGSVTTGNWVTPGLTFYLVDVSQPSVPVPLASTTPVVKQGVPPSFTISPDPIYVPYSSSGVLTGTANMSWNSPLTSNVEIRVGSPTGSVLMANGGPTGTATATGWVTNGTVFYLIDSGTGAVLNTATAYVQLQPESGYLLLAQNPVNVPAGQQYGTANLVWSSSNATTVQVHVGSPSGPLFTQGGPQGTATASGWIENGTVLYLQDVSTGQPLTSQFTIATQTVSFLPTVPTASFQASPNPIPVPEGTQFATTTFYWTAIASVITTEIHIGAPNGPLFAQGSTSGTATASGWVTDGTTFYLQDVTKQKPLTSLNTLGTVTVHFQQFPPGQ
ncbi:MAG: hypothetical protein WAM39_12420 [Bryobacteraceae bacterium]